MRVLAWIVEGTWEAAVDAAARLGGDEVTLLHVVTQETVDASAGALAGLLGRRRPEGMEAELAGIAEHAARALLDAAAHRLGRDARARVVTGRAEEEVVLAARDADYLVVARDSRHPGPKSLGKATRFVVDHAPCTVVLAWREGAPEGPPLPPHPG